MRPNVLLLAAGKSTRIAGVSGGLPKPLLRVGDRAIIEHDLEWLASEGISSCWINLHYRPDAIRSALRDGSKYGVSIEYSEEPEILGTAGAWKKVARARRGRWLVVYGDNLMRFDLAAMIEAHERRSALVTIALFDQKTHQHTGVAGGRVELGADGVIERFVEGGAAAADAPSLVNAGAYLLEPSVAAGIGEGLQDFGRDVFPSLVKGGGVYGHVIEPDGFCLGLDTPESFAAGQRLVESHEVHLR